MIPQFLRYHTADFAVSYFFHSSYSVAVEDICDSMGADKTIANKQYLAKILFTREQLEQKVVAKRVGITEKTMSRWVNDFAWKKLRSRLLLSKDEQINAMYEELEEIKEKILSKPKGDRYADTKLADIRSKTTSSIKDLETDLGIREIVDVGIIAIKDAQKNCTHEEVMWLTDFWHGFLQRQLKK
jgi:transcriptional regulator with XRE-family HTH domain